MTDAADVNLAQSSLKKLLNKALSHPTAMAIGIVALATIVANFLLTTSEDVEQTIAITLSVLFMSAIGIALSLGQTTLKRNISANMPAVAKDFVVIVRILMWIITIYLSSILIFSVVKRTPESVGAAVCLPLKFIGLCSDVVVVSDGAEALRAETTKDPQPQAIPKAEPIKSENGRTSKYDQCMAEADVSGKSPSEVQAIALNCLKQR